MPTGSLGQRVEVVVQFALLAAGQVRLLPAVSTVAGTLPVRGPAPAGAAPAGRVRRCGFHRPATTRHRTPWRHVQFLGRLGEPHHPVETVMVGQCDGPQIEPGGLLDEFLRRAGAVEEAVGRMRVQLGVRAPTGHRPRSFGRLVHAPACVTRPGCRRRRRSARPAAIPPRRGLPVSTRSISVQLGGPLCQPTPPIYRTSVRCRLLGELVNHFRTGSRSRSKLTIAIELNST